MADNNDATLVYRGEYDNSRLLSAMEAQDQAFTESGKTAEKAFEKISNADSQAAGIAKSTAAMRRDLQEENADKAIKAAEREAESVGRAKSRAEAEYLRVESQAAAAEATAGASRINRAMERENAYHQTRLQALVGNDEAQESEVRRHTAVMVTLQTDMSTRSIASTQQMISRMGSMGNQVQGIQNAFMGAALAAGDTDSKFGQMIGRMALLTSGALGVAQAYEMITAAEVGMGRAMLIGLPILAAVGVAMALLLEHQEKLKELAKHDDWLGDPKKAAAVAAAMDEAEAATKRMTDTQANAFASYMSTGAMLGANREAFREYGEAQTKIQAITGLTSDELTKLYGNLDRARYAFQQLADERLVSQQFAIERALIGAKKDSAEKAVALQEVSNRQAEAAIKNHYAAILLDTKKGEEEKKRAVEQMGKELAKQEELNAALIAEARARFDNKQDKKDESKAAEQVKEYHRMELESAKSLDEALAALDQNAYQRAIGKIDSEWAATQRLYSEKKAAAVGNTKALADLDQWYGNEQMRFEAQAGAAVIERNQLEIKTHQDYQKQLAALDVQIRDSKIQATGDAFAAQKQQVLDAEEAANTQALNNREKWTKELGDKVAAEKMASDMIEKNHTLSNARLLLITKQETEKETQVRLQGISAVISAGEGFLAAAGAQNKALFIMSKIAAAANILVMGQLAIAQVHASTPPPAWPFLDGMAIAATGLQEATIAATTIAGFRKGGYSGDLPEDAPAGMVHGREYVVNAPTVRDLGGPGGVEHMLAGGGGGDTYHMGDTYVSLPAGTTPEHAREVGAALAEGKIDRLRSLKRDMRLINDLRISE